MKRRELRQLEKKMGLSKIKKNMSRNERFELMRQNIINGKKQEEEMKDLRRRQEQANQDQVNSNKIASIATELMIKNGISYIDAIEEAKKQVEL